MARALNSAELAWAGASGNAVGETASWLGSWDALTGGDFLFGIEISNSPSALALGEVYFIAANGLVYTQTVASNEVDSVAQDSLRGRFRRRCRCHWHSVLRHAYRQPWNQRRQPIAGPSTHRGVGQRVHLPDLNGNQGRRHYGKSHILFCLGVLLLDYRRHGDFVAN